MMLDAKITVVASTNNQNDIVLDIIRKAFEKEGMTVLNEHRNIVIVNGKLDQLKIKFEKTIEGRKEND